MFKTTTARAGLRRALIRTCSVLALAAGAAAPDLAQAAPQKIEIATQPLNTALLRLSTETRTVIYANSRLVEGKTARALSGSMTVERALDAMLAGTGLTYSQEPDGVITLAARDEAPPTGPASGEEPSDERSHTLDSIVVTAEKREQRLVEVPTSVTVLDGDRIREDGAERLVDIAKLTAGVQAAPQYFGGEMPSFTIRGVGFDDIRPNGNPATSLNIDGVYQGSAALGGGQFFDIERVEILKGPQGTLYGQNSTAGAINVISRRPGKTFGGFVKADYGNYNYARVEAAVGGPISSVVSARFAALYRRSDGFQTNNGTGATTGFTSNRALPPIPFLARDEKATGSDFYAARATFVVAPSEHTEFTLILHGSDQQGGGAEFARVTPASGFGPNRRFEYDSNIPSVITISTYGVTASLNHDLGGGHSLIVVGGYDHLKRRSQHNLDATPQRTGDVYYRDGTHQVYLEARVQNADDADLRWIIGATGFRSTVDLDQRLEVLDSLRGYIVGVYEQKRSSYGVFADGTYEFGSGTELGVGLRYSKDEANFRGVSDGQNPYGVSLLPILIPSYPYAFDRDYDDSDVSGRIYLSQKFGRWTSVYGSVRRGYKGGGFDATTPANDDESAPFRAESVWTYEIGVKMLPPGAFLQFEAAAFYNDYDDLQANARREYANGLIGSTRANVGKATTWGAELTSIVSPAKTVSIQLSAAYLGNDIKEIRSADPVERARRLNAELPYAPKLSLYAKVDWRIPLSEGLDLKLSLSGQHTSRFYADLDNFGRNDGHFLGDARAALRFANGLEAAAWVRNLTNTYYPKPSGDLVIPGAPRTYGVSLDYRF